MKHGYGFRVLFKYIYKNVICTFNYLNIHIKIYNAKTRELL